MTDETNIVADEDGSFVIFADVPGSGVSRVAVAQQSGNPRHDTRSGKFGSGGGGRRGPPAPANADPLEWSRMLDAAREAAREFDVFGEGDVREFLAGRAKDPNAVDIESFMKLVQEQQKTDLVDIIDQQLRSGGMLKRNRRMVRVSAPRGYMNRTLRQLPDDQLAEIMHRLESRGHTTDDVAQYFEKRVRSETHEKAQQKKDAIGASNQWDADVLEFEATDEPFDDQVEPVELAAKLAEKIAANIQPPVVNIHPQIIVEPPKPTRKVPVRDEKGLIVEVREEPE